jgi:uncharacterized protein (DUF488 family)
MTTSNRQPFELFTIGYQGRTLDDVLDRLMTNGVQVLIDVRHTPWSHKPGFTKKNLSAELTTHGIEYAHLRQFGSDPAIRRRLKETGNRVEFAQAYSDYLLTIDPTIESTFEPYAGRSVCLLCLEANPDECHRSILANRIAFHGISSQPIHL